MQAVSEIADWWDKNRRESTKALERFVDENPGLFAVVVATATETAMELGAGLVDVLRLGEGLAEGGWKGAGQDAIRLIQLLPGAGRLVKGGAQLAKRAGVLGKAVDLKSIFRTVDVARVIADSPGGNCGWVAAARALRQSGQRAFVAVDDLADAVGRPLKSLAGMTVEEMGEVLKQIGAKFQPFKVINGFDELAQALPKNGSVAVIGLEVRYTAEAAKITGKVTGGHAIMAFWDDFGRMRFMEKNGVIYNSIDDIVKARGLVFEMASPESITVIKSTAKVAALAHARNLGNTLMQSSIARYLKFNASIIENVGVKIINGTGVMAMELKAAMLGDAESTAQAFDQFKTTPAAVKKRVIRLPEMDLTRPAPAAAPKAGDTYTVVKGDTLSGIAERVYGNMHKWKPIYFANKSVIGHNPNLIEIGQQLFLPVLKRPAGIKAKAK